MTPPRALQPFFAFAQALRRTGFAVAPDQTIGFIEAVGLLGPSSMTDLHRAGRALFAVPPEKFPDYDAVFSAVFLGQTVEAPVVLEDDEVTQARETTGDTLDAETGDEEDPGREASLAERDGHRDLSGLGDEDALREFSRRAPDALPRRRAYRRRAAKKGDRPDLRRSLREAARRDGEVPRLFETRRKTRQRPILLLVDVSGSMQGQSDGALRLAHALVQVADRVEVFTLGTQLTRITPALRLRDLEAALGRAAATVSDIDGGTRLGAALQAFLSVPRFAGRARGAAVTILSDGLERGEPEVLADAVSRLARLAWRLDWLSPLAADPAYRPETAALKSALPYLDSFAPGDSPAAIAAHLLGLARAA